MAASYDARYFDGKTAASRAARVSLAAQGLIIEVAGGRQGELWLYRELKPPERLPGGGGTRVGSEQAPDAQLVVEDAAFRDELLRQLPHFAGHAGRWRRHRGEIVGVLAIIAVIVAALFGLPHLSRPLAHVIPRAWDDRLGAITEAQLTQGRRVCHRPAGVAAFNAMLRPLLRVSGYDGPVRLRVIDHPMVNAFAAAGGRIIFMRGLIDKAETADEVAGVLAHELGHVIAHHPTANAIRVLGVMTFLDLVVGDSSAVLKALGQGGALVLLFAYTRADEAEADAIALRLLHDSGIDAGGFASFFARIEKPGRKSGQGGRAEGESFMDYFRTHPATRLREQQARAAAGQGRRPALDPEAWRALKGICVGTAD